MRDMLTPDQWYGVVTANDGGLLPVCCGNISVLREELSHLLTSGYVTPSLGKAIEAAGHDLVDSDDALGVLLRAVITHLDGRDDGWRDDDLSSLDEISAALDLGIGWPIPREDGDPLVSFSQAMTLLATLPASNADELVAWSKAIRTALQSSVRCGFNATAASAVQQAAVAITQEIFRRGSLTEDRRG